MEDSAVLHEMVRDADGVVHCGFPGGQHAPELEGAALDVMLDAINSDHEAFVYTSGIWVYGSRGDAIVGEDAPLAPTPFVAWRPSAPSGGSWERPRTICARSSFGPAIVYGDGGGLVGGMVDQGRRARVHVVGDGTNDRWSSSSGGRARRTLRF